MRNILPKILSFAAYIAVATFAGQAAESETAKGLFQTYYYEALRAKAADDKAASADLLYFCAELNHNSAETMAELGNIFSMSNKVGIAKEYMIKAVQLDNNNYWYKQALANIYSNQKELDKAAATFEDIIKQYPEKKNLYPTLASIYSNNLQFDKAIDAWEKYEAANGISEYSATQKFLVYINMDKRKKAFKEIDKLIKEYPNTLKYKILKANLLTKAEEDKQALKLYNEILKIEPDNADANSQIGSYYISQGEFKKGLDYTFKVLRNKDADLKIKDNILSLSADTLLIQYFSDTIFKEMMSMHGDEYFPYWRYSIYLLQKSDSSFVDYTNKALDINPMIEEGWSLLSKWHAKNSDYKNGEKTLVEALKYFPKKPEYRYELGLLMLDTNRELEAIKNITIAADEMKKTDIFSASVFYGITADIYAKLNDKEKAFALYDTALVYNENNFAVLNNYAYYLSIENMKLDKAERMSGKAVKAEPNNPTFLDTYAWIYFMQKNYMLALMYIEQAYKNGGSQSIESVEHYGDILFMTGDIDGAIKKWEEAKNIEKKNKKFTPDNDRIPILNKKIKERKIDFNNQ